ncbi:MAG: OsmC family protein [Gemmatimonadales bacterium]|nr:OsmC family protein [Gemmatimonadales bacterium]
MRVILERRNQAVHFTATTESGATVAIDGAPAIGGQGLGARPMELVLTALGACSGIDVVTILAKQRQEVHAVRVTVEGEREPGREPSLFATVHVRFEVTGGCDPDKLAHAVGLSMEKYCSVARILERSATITWSHAVLPAA